MPGQKSKAEIIDERKTNLPLPNDPPVASDWNSADERNVNITRRSKDSERPLGVLQSHLPQGGQLQREVVLEMSLKPI